MKINNYKWKIKHVKLKDEKMYNKETDIQNLGLTVYPELTIYICKDMDKELIKSTVLHELIHAYIFSYGYTLEDEENFCDFIGANFESISNSYNEIISTL